MDKKRNFLFSLGSLVILGIGLSGVVSLGRASERSREYFVAVEPQKSDTVRMIEAYERLSSQYLTLVQQNLAQMAAVDRELLAKLDSIETKLDALAVRLSRLEGAATQETP
ncbi:MAG: hypothetical protein GXY41_02615 [Phycisphaerae bacterium]|nr:hypothetical protein [Phycisphaerae bacterium]